MIPPRAPIQEYLGGEIRYMRPVTPFPGQRLHTVHSTVPLRIVEWAVHHAILMEAQCDTSSGF